MYDFEQLSLAMNEAYPQAEVVGLTTSGEIAPSGLINNSFSAMAFEQTMTKAVLMKDIERYPIFYRKELQEALSQVKINSKAYDLTKEGLGLVFPNGLISAEEKMLSVVNSVFEHDGFPLFGGTAGDDIKFQATYVSYNGEVTSKGGVVIFMNPDLDFVIQKENIFVPTGKKMKVTKVDIETRTVLELNGKKATTEYARLLGVSESQLSNHFMTNPIGRTTGEEVFIASPFQVLPNGGIQFYCQVHLGSVVDLLEPKDPVETLKESLHRFESKFQRIEGVLAINCILRKLQFENQRLIPTLNQQFKNLPSLCGFSSYGEQLDKMQLNQTLVLLGFGQKKPTYGGSKR